MSHGIFGSGVNKEIGVRVLEVNASHHTIAFWTILLLLLLKVL